jgi:CRP/FNR family transcriptional regulator
VTAINYCSGDEVFAPGSGAGTVFRVVDGYVRLYKVLPDGRSINLALLGPGEFFVQANEEDGEATGCIAEALADTVVEQVDRTAFMEQLDSDPALARAMITSQARQIASLHTLVEHLLARDTGVRLATTLLQLADGFGTDRPDGRVAIGLPITHQSLANMIGSNRVTVTRKLLEMQQTHAVASEGRNNLVIDPDALREVSEME